MSILGDLRDGLKAIDDIRRLAGAVDRMADTLSDLEKRVIRLEEREALVMERSQAAARDAAATAGQRMSETLLERVIRLETALSAARSENRLDTPHP